MHMFPRLSPRARTARDSVLPYAGPGFEA